MRNIARLSIERPVYPWLLILTCAVGGLVGLREVGRLEDPPFPIKTVLVVTEYPGASAEEVEQEVTDALEAALQELPQGDEILSKSLPGRSEIQVEIQEQYGSEDTPQIFDELRRRVREATARLPPGAGEPIVEDDFGDVYGILYAVTAPGYAPSDIHDMSRRLANGLRGVPGVAKVATAGEPHEAIHVEVDHLRLGRLGVPVDQLIASVAAENQVMPPSSLAFEGRRLLLAPEQAMDTAGAVADMRIGRPGTTEMVRLVDIADIRREEVETPRQIIRHDGERAFTVGVSVVAEENVVRVGKQVDARMAELIQQLPVGVSAQPVYAQHQVVEQAMQRFLTNLMLSVATVVLALCLFMGWRAGIVVGAVLLLTVLGTLALMAVLGIELQRISLGALMIAMGMLVDNGIVVAEGMVIGVRRGLTPAEAADRSVRRTQVALLGATVIGIVAFGPISLTDDNGGHFLRSLFQVVAIALLLSWVLAVTVVPMLGSHLLKAGAAQDENALYSGWMYTPYRALIRFGLRRAWFTTGVLVGVLAACLWGFQFVKQAFFPTTDTPLFYVDYRLPEGTDILTTSQSVHDMEAAFADMPGVLNVTTFVGQGASRFTSVHQVEQPNSAYAQLVIRVADVRAMDTIMAAAGPRLREIRPDAEVMVTRAQFSPSGNAKIVARFSGPDARILRHLAEQALAVYLAHDLIDRGTDWRQRALQIAPRFNEPAAEIAGVSRRDVHQALAYATRGLQVGLYREGDKLIPIIARAPETERADPQALPERLVWSASGARHIPMRQVAGFDLVADDVIIHRRDRVRTIQARANPPVGHNANRAHTRVRPAVEAIPLPPGYTLEWGGEYEDNKMAYATLFSKIPIALGLMFLITILMFGRMTEPVVIWLCVPMTICGVVIGLLATDLSFTFPSFLGFLSLSGMLIKNCIVLLDEIHKRLEEGACTLETMVAGSVSRLRPVLLAAGTTIAGMSPLLADPFFRQMAVCIMSGLAFATLLTLVAAPVFYRIALRRRLQDTLPAVPVSA